MLRVLQVHSGNLYGGIETFHTTLARAARSGGIELEFAMCFEGRAADEIRAAGATVHALGSVRLRAPATLLRARSALARVLAGGGFDVAVTNGVWSHAVFGGTIRRSGTPLVAHMHDAAGAKLNWLETLAARQRPDLVVCNSAFTAGTVEKIFPGVAQTVVHLCVAQSEPPPGAREATRRALGIADDTVIILQVSRMEAWKGHELHIAALGRLRELTRRNWVCLFAGGAQRPQEEEYVAHLRTLVAEAGLTDRVRFLGQRSDVPSLLAAADVFSQPNKSPEPFGIVFIEALGAGLPIVTTAMGGPAEFVDGTCGILVPPGDAAAVADALANLIEDGALRRSMAPAARARAVAISDTAARVADLRDAFARVARRPRTSNRSSGAPGAYFIIAGDFVRTGGMDRANHALAQHVARTGRETHVLAFRVADDLAAEPNVHVHIAPRPWKRDALGSPFLGAVGLLEALRLGAGTRVIVNGGNCPVPGAVNWVHYVHAAAAATSVHVGTRRRSVIARSTERIAIRAARLVLANSERTRRDVIDLLGIPESRVQVVYLGVDPDEFRPRSAEERRQARTALGWDDRPRIAFVGALGDERKGFQVLFAAFQSLVARPSFDAQLVVVGTGAALPSWKQRAMDAGLASRTEFLGFRRDVANVVSACDLLVAPSLYEPYGLGAHEALCCEVPTIVSASSGVAERYPAALRDWLLADPRDDVDLAARIGRALESQRTSPALADLSRELRARTWDTVAADIVARTEA